MSTEELKFDIFTLKGLNVNKQEIDCFTEHKDLIFKKKGDGHSDDFPSLNYIHHNALHDTSQNLIIEIDEETKVDKEMMI